MNEQTDVVKKQKLTSLILIIFGILVLIIVVAISQLPNIKKSALDGSGLRKVAAPSSLELPTIVIDITSDGTKPPASPTTPIYVDTDYQLVVTNNSGLKQGIYIPSRDIKIVLENGGTDTTKTIKFSATGDYDFFPSVYQSGWDKWKSLFTVIAIPSITPYPTATP